MNKTLVIFYIVGVLLVLAISVVAYCFFLRYKFEQFTKFLYLLMLSSSYLLFAQILKYRSLNFYVDFSHWAQVLYSISTTGKPLSSNVELMVPGAVNYFSVHFVPLFYLFSIPFKLWPYSETIIIMNFVLMISSVIPLYKLALVYSKDRLFGLFMVVLLLWYPTFQYITLYEFEMLRFSIPIILWMLYFWEKGKIIPYFIFVALAVLVREEVGLTIMMFGLYLLLVEKRYRIGLITSLIGLSAFLIIVRIIMPALRGAGNTEHIALVVFSDFGNTFEEVITNIVTHPALILTKILKPVKLANAFMLFLPLLFVSFLAPGVLIAVLANFGIVLLSQYEVHSSYMLYYLSPSVPFIFCAFIKGWPKLLVLLEHLAQKWRPHLKVDISSAAMMSVLSGLLVANVFFGPSFISLQFWFRNLRPAPFRTQNFHYTVYKITDHHRKVEQFVSLIPDTAIVSAEVFLHPRLARKKAAMVFPQLESLDGKIKADYVFIDKKNPIKTGTGAVPDSWDGMRKNPQLYYDQIEKYPENWELVSSEDGYFLYRRIQEL